MRPFEGLRVLDLTHVFAGPFCTYQLGVLGAEVIKIEPVDRPDMTRFEGSDPALNADGLGLSYLAQNGGKRCLALDLRSEEGRGLFDRLVETADIVVQNYARGAARRLGLEHDRLRELNPRLIYCAISGFGQTGPKADDPAYDPVIQAFTGVMSSNGTPDGAPLRIGPAMVDYGTGAQAALAISAALYARSQDGAGRAIDVAMADAALMLMASHSKTALSTGATPRPNGNSDPSLAGYACYATAEGELMVGAFTNRQMAALMRALGNEDAARAIEETPRHQIGARREMDAEFLQSVLKTRTASEWETFLNACHVPAARVRRVEEALDEPQTKSRTAVQDCDGSAFPVAGFTFDRGAPRLDHAPRAHGADSRSVLAEIGVTDDQFDALRARGIVD